MYLLVGNAGCLSDDSTFADREIGGAGESGVQDGVSPLGSMSPRDGYVDR